MPMKPENAALLKKAGLKVPIAMRDMLDAAMDEARAQGANTVEVPTDGLRIFYGSGCRPEVKAAFVSLFNLIDPYHEALKLVSEYSGIEPGATPADVISIVEGKGVFYAALLRWFPNPSSKVGGAYEVQQKGNGRFATLAEAMPEAADWAKAANLQLVEGQKVD